MVILACTGDDPASTSGPEIAVHNDCYGDSLTNTELYPYPDVIAGTNCNSYGDTLADTNLHPYPHIIADINCNSYGDTLHIVTSGGHPVPHPRLLLHR